LAVLVAAIVAIVVTPLPANAQDKGFDLARGDYLLWNDYIHRDACCLSLGIRWHYWLILQPDFNMVLYRGTVEQMHVGKFDRVCWATNTNKPSLSVTHVTYQQDGNFVMYSINGAPVWASNTVGNPGTTVDINGYGALYVGTKRISANCQS
jgi:hypothetical protein